MGTCECHIAAPLFPAACLAVLFDLRVSGLPVHMCLSLALPVALSAGCPRPCPSTYLPPTCPSLPKAPVSCGRVCAEMRHAASP